MTDNGSPTDASADQSAEKFPLRLRVHALARTLGLTSKQVLVHLQEMGVTARTAQSSISRADAEAVEARIGGATDAGPADVAPAAPDAAPAASDTAPAAASLFSAVEPAEPIAAARGDVSAPLFLAPDKKAAADDAEEPAKKAAAKKAGAKKVAAETAPVDNGDVENDDSDKAAAKKTAAKKAGRKKADEQKAGEQKADASDSTPAAADDVAAPAETADADVATDTDAEHKSDSDEHGEGRSRRRRRGRRGRGRGRGDQGPDADSTNSDSTHSDSTHDDNSTSDDGNSDTSEAAAAANATDASDPKAGKSDGDSATGGDRASDSDKASGDTTSGGENGESASREDESASTDGGDSDNASGSSSRRRRRRRRRRGGSDDDSAAHDDPPNTVVHEREPRTKRVRDEVQGISGSTRLEAKRQRRRDGRDAGRRRPPILTESEFLARRESVERVMVVRERAANSAIHAEQPHATPTEDYTQIAVLEDGVLVEHFVTTETSQSMVGNIYLGRVQNVLPGMEAAFVDIGRGRNGVLYAGEVNWEAAGLAGGSRKIEQALKPGDPVLVQVSKDPIGHKGARLTTQISLAGRYLVYVPGGTSTGISRKLPDTERKRLKQILAKIVPDEAGVIIRTASEGVSAEDLESDVQRLEAQWKGIEAAAEEHKTKASGTTKALYEEPDLLVRVVRDIFNEDFTKLVIEGDRAWQQVSGYVGDVAPDLSERLEKFEKKHADAADSFTVHRVDEQLAKALDRKVWLPSGGTLIIEHTEAMTVVDVNTGKFTGSGGNLEETVTRNNLEAAEEIVRQMRLRDIGGMIIVDFIDMVLESNRDLVLRRLTEALARDRTRHQVSEVTSLGLVQMTRKRLGTGLLEAFSTTCTACSGRGVIVHENPIEVRHSDDSGRGNGDSGSRRSRRSRRRSGDQSPSSNGGSNGGSNATDQEQSASQTKAPHKPAAEHPMFRAMAHHEQEEEAAPTAESKVAESAQAESAQAESAPAESKPAESKPAGTETAGTETAETATDPQPAVVTRRRRRTVRRAASPTVAAEPVEAVVSAEPMTTVAPQASEPIVAVTRSARRRGGRRGAGSPASEE